MQVSKEFVTDTRLAHAHSSVTEAAKWEHKNDCLYCSKTCQNIFFEKTNTPKWSPKVIVQSNVVSENGPSPI